MKLENFKEIRIKKSHLRSILGGGNKTEAHTRAGVSYSSDEEMKDFLRCFKSDGTYDDYPQQ